MSADPFATSNIVEHDANLGNSGSNNNHTDNRPLSSLSVYPVTPIRTAHSAGPSSPQQQGAGSITRMRQQSSAAAGSPLHRSQSRSSDKSDAYSRVSRLMSEAKSHNKDWARPSPAFRSGTPRGCLSPTAKPPTDAIYFTEKETRTKQKHGWGLSKTPQRLGARHATDAFYDPKLPEQMTYVQKGVQSIPSTPRIPTSRASETPAVGQYTSPYISCGMGM